MTDPNKPTETEDKEKEKEEHPESEEEVEEEVKFLHGFVKGRIIKVGKSLELDEGDMVYDVEDSSFSAREKISRQFKRHSILIERLSKEVDTTTKEMKKLKSELYNLQWHTNSGLDISEAKVRRYVPCRIYLQIEHKYISFDPLTVTYDIPVTSYDVESAIMNLFETIEFEYSHIEYEVKESIWKKFWVESRDKITVEELFKRLKQFESAIRKKYIEKSQADIDQAQAEGAAALIKSLEGVDEACIQAGSIFLIKIRTEDGKPFIISKTLTDVELEKLENAPDIMKNPREASFLFFPEESLPQNGKEAQESR